MKTICKLLFLLMLPAILLLSVSAAGTVEDEIRNSCYSGQTAELSSYNITCQQLDNLLKKMMDSGQLPWFTTGQYTYTYDKQTNVIQTFTPENLPESYDRSLYEEKLAELMAACIHPGMTDEEIALSVHDKLILMGQYDETLQKNTGYDLLINGTSVCAGYADLYRDILNRAGIHCVNVSSEAMEHAWNLVQLDDQWYHVDLTWDDPTPDVYGSVKHDYFLLTDAQISSGDRPHYGWSTTIACNDEQYRLSYWRTVESPVLFPGDGYAYYLNAKELSYQVIQRDATGKESVLFEEKQPTVLNFGHGMYTYYHTGLSYWDGMFYIGTLDKIHTLSTDGKTQVVYEYDTAANSRYIYSCSVLNDRIYMITANHGGDFFTEEAPLTVSPEQLSQRHTHSYTKTEENSTCTVPGFTVYTCDCGITFQSDWTLQAHNFVGIADKDGHTREGCSQCGHTRITGTVTYTPTINETPKPTTDKGWAYAFGRRFIYVLLAGGLIGLIFRKKKS